MSLLTRVKVNLETDITSGISSHRAAGLIILPFPPYVIPVPAPAFNVAMEMPSAQRWPPGMATGRNLMTFTVRHCRQAIVLANHDCGPMLTHITLPVLVNVLYPVHSMLSSRRVVFSSLTVRMNKQPVGFTSAVPAPIPMMGCGEPAPLPTCFPMTSEKNTVSVGMTWADLINGVVVYLAEMAKSLILGKVVGKVMGKPKEIPDYLEQKVIKTILKKMTKEPGGKSKEKTVHHLNKMALANLSGFELHCAPLSPGPAQPSPQTPTRTGGETGQADTIRKPQNELPGVVYIVKNAAWDSLPFATRIISTSQIRKLFKFGKMQMMVTRLVAPGSIPRRLNLIDAVVRCSLTMEKGLPAFRTTVLAQLEQISRRIPEVESTRKAFAEFQHKPGADGVAAVLKQLFTGGTDPQLVCVTEATLGLVDTLGWWKAAEASFGRKYDCPVPERTDYPKLTSGSSATQETFGAIVGNLIAHEIRHQLALSTNPIGPGLEHSKIGLGMEQAPYWVLDNTFAPEDQEVIRQSLDTLLKTQGKAATLAIDR